MIWMIVCGGIAGLAGGKLMRGEGFGLLGNIVVGIIGGIIGGSAFGLLGFETTSIIGELITATIGAAILIFVVDKVRGKD
ncbi:MAG: putative membrane protein YeaQ/YmgE (transglycosylase-associated protein family) [Limisphaerales bacterium]|jgi:uncharacterized membrane protein YeaQ/YmgE (transglycosylase-associated protein family)